MKKNNSLLGIVAGIGIGLAIGVLFAPEKGRDTRKKLADKGYDDTSKYYQDLLDQLINHPKIFSLSLVNLVVWFHIAGYNSIYSSGIWRADNLLH